MMNRATSLAAALCITALLPAAAAAQTADAWEFRAAIYGYFPTMSGTTTFPPTGGSSSASVDIDTILDNLKFTFMGQIEARKGVLGVFTDVIYLDLGNSRSGSRDLTIGSRALPAGVSADLEFDLKGWLWTLAGTYRAVSKPHYTLDLLAGARMLDLEQTLGWQLAGSIGSVPVLDRSGGRKTELTNWDAIVGVKGRASFGEQGRWFVPYYLDIGTGESKFTWQTTVGVGYSFDWGSLVAAWRYVGYDMKSGKDIEELSFNGPGIAVVFGW